MLEFTSGAWLMERKFFAFLSFLLVPRLSLDTLPWAMKYSIALHHCTSLHLKLASASYPEEIHGLTVLLSKGFADLA